MNRVRAIVCGALCLLPMLAKAADWPCFRADAQRSGATDEALSFPLSPAWIVVADPPAPAWPDSHWEENRVAFDHAFAPVIAGGLVLFGSSADDTLRALDLETGEERWSFVTGGPVRFAPHVESNRCYVAGDDGFVHCLDAASGKSIWSVRVAPEDDQVIGNGRMISRWPCRSGVLVDRGVVYVTAGMWPTEGIVVTALDAGTGRVLWCNDTSGYYYRKQPYPSGYAFGGVAPQGYLLLADDVLLVPTGRGLPAGFDRVTGRLLHCRPAATTDKDGASWGLVVGQTVIARLWPGWSRVRSGALQGLRANTGNSSWRLPALHWPAVLGKDTLYAPAFDSKLNAMTCRASRPGSAVWSAPCEPPLSMAFAGGTLVLGGTNHLQA
ncbi:MAG: PQQ-binding-like beta-propeller repeat protein, partial [Lentisphaerae bacterium]|nr:PQQ-binding-like beta-propeller repeat protein [Lentisphaerota bacterium]